MSGDEMSVHRFVPGMRLMRYKYKGNLQNHLFISVSPFVIEMYSVDKEEFIFMNAHFIQVI